MNKPLSLAIEETKQSLVTTINESGLHPYILDSIISNIYNEIHMLYQRQLIEETKQYQESQKNEKEVLKETVE